MGVGGRCVGAWVGVDVGWGDKKLKKSKKMRITSAEFNNV